MINKVVLLIFFLTIVSCDRDHSQPVEKPVQIVKEQDTSNIKSPDVSIDSTTYTVVKIDSNSTNQQTADSLDKIEREIKLIKRLQTQAAGKQDHVSILRKIFDHYRKNRTNHENIDNDALTLNQKGSDEEIITLDYLLENGYLTSKFVPMDVFENTKGGFNMDIIFNKKQDKIFQVWMDFDKDKGFYLKRISIPYKYDERMMKYYRKLYSIYLNDENYGV